MMARQRFDLHKDIRAWAWFSTWTYGATRALWIMVTALSYAVDMKEIFKFLLLTKPLLT